MKNELPRWTRIRFWYLARRDDLKMCFLWRRWKRKNLQGQKTYFTCLDGAVCAYITPHGGVVFDQPRLGLSSYNVMAVLREFEESFTPDEKAEYNRWLAKHIKTRIA